jgi:hypothetical protein
MIGIQKQILLLTDYHYSEFENYLINTNSDLSVKLVSNIRHSKTVHESDELCALTYGDCEEKTRKKFLQLTHHTFKLTSFLSRNYPNYLKHNLQLIEELLSQGEKEKANLIANWMNDVAEKIEDYTTLIEVNKFFAQQCYITESREATKYHEKINEYISLENTKNLLYHYLRENLFYKGKENISKTHSTKDLNFFDEYILSKSNSINILARFGKYFEQSFLSHPDFYKPETVNILDELEKDFLNNAHVCFHYLDDMYFKILGLRLQMDINNNNTISMMQEIKKMNQVSSFLKFWGSYINLSELFAFSVEVSHYLNLYALTFKENYLKTVPREIKENIIELRKKLEAELNKDIWKDSQYIIKLINLKCIYAAILLTGNEEDKLKSTQIIEDTLTSYKQVPFQKFLDGMFVTLIMGQFSLKLNEEIAVTYKRYKKLTSDQIVLRENDLTIEAYYYTSQYLMNKRKQYIEKIKLTYDTAHDLEHVKNLIIELVSYYHIPAEL